MKTYYCPLCGGELKLYAPFPQESIAMPTCLTCGYQILNDSALRYGSRTTQKLTLCNYQEVETFISKFPPLMRLRVGDKIQVRGVVGTIDEIDRDYSYLPIHVDFGRSEVWVSPAAIEKYPWELEQ